ncbi:LytR/AlgR family response regulator transcription factor [Olivibacter sitiensis]|uniref:LytR/AlgR family response regulator transcription factor n=1 Tax=Olivibacter sitiensis TaxID=376470 RepID=UPI00040182B3|nr:response regulator transcription factor [Olivibacter sitiensis]
MIKCIIIDDEQHAIDILEVYCRKTPYLELVGSFTDSREAFNVIMDRYVELVFLDINMPGMTGLEFVKMLKNPISVVFTTAYPEYAVSAFDNDATDYLLKPFSFERFIVATQKVLNRFAKPRPFKENAYDWGHFFVKTDLGKLTKIAFKEILYVEGLKNYVVFQLIGGRKLVTLLNMKDVEEELEEFSFFRIHKSYIVSIDKIASVDGNRVSLTEGEHELPIGSTYKDAFLHGINLKLRGGASQYAPR